MTVLNSPYFRSIPAVLLGASSFFFLASILPESLWSGALVLCAALAVFVYRCVMRGTRVTPPGPDELVVPEPPQPLDAPVPAVDMSVIRDQVALAIAGVFDNTEITPVYQKQAETVMPYIEAFLKGQRKRVAAGSDPKIITTLIATRDELLRKYQEQTVGGYPYAAQASWEAYQKVCKQLDQATEDGL